MEWWRHVELDWGQASGLSRVVRVVLRSAIFWLVVLGLKHDCIGVSGVPWRSCTILRLAIRGRSSWSALRFTVWRGSSWPLTKRASRPVSTVSWRTSVWGPGSGTSSTRRQRTRSRTSPILTWRKRPRITTGFVPVQCSAPRLPHWVGHRKALATSTIDADSVNMDCAAGISLQCLQDLELQFWIIVQSVVLTPCPGSCKWLSSFKSNSVSSVVARTVSLNVIPSQANMALPGWVLAFSEVENNTVCAWIRHLIDDQPSSVQDHRSPSTSGEQESYFCK